MSDCFFPPDAEFDRAFADFIKEAVKKMEEKLGADTGMPVEYRMGEHYDIDEVDWVVNNNPTPGQEEYSGVSCIIIKRPDRETVRSFGVFFHMDNGKLICNSVFTNDEVDGLDADEFAVKLGTYWALTEVDELAEDMDEQL